MSSSSCLSSNTIIKPCCQKNCGLSGCHKHPSVGLCDKHCVYCLDSNSLDVKHIPSKPAKIDENGCSHYPTCCSLHRELGMCKSCISDVKCSVDTEMCVECKSPTYKGFTLCKHHYIHAMRIAGNMCCSCELDAVTAGLCKVHLDQLNSIANTPVASTPAAQQLPTPSSSPETPASIPSESPPKVCIYCDYCKTFGWKYCKVCHKFF